MKTAEEIQGEISEIQTSGIPFVKEVKAINELIEKYQKEVYNQAIDDAKGRIPYFSNSPTNKETIDLILKLKK